MPGTSHAGVVHIIKVSTPIYTDGPLCRQFCFVLDCAVIKYKRPDEASLRRQPMTFLLM